MPFLGIYTAIYDYVPQGEAELAIAVGDILYVLEKSNEDNWWKAKKKAGEDDDDEPVGLIPNNYVEEAQPTSHARALYDYARQTDEELSFSEDAKLEVYDTSDPDWILVGLDGEYGFAPANYIELQDGPAETVATPPSLPRRPAQVEDEEEAASPESPRSPVHNPAAAVASILQQRKLPPPAVRSPPQFTPEASDDDEGPPPSLPVRPNSQIQQPARRSEPIDSYVPPRSPSPTGPVASPPYNRATFNRGMDDEMASRSPGGFHMYNINEMVQVMGKRKKMPTTLGINIATGVIMIAPEKSRDGPEQKWTAEKMTHYSIESKHIFIELVKPSKSLDFHAGSKDTAQEIVAALGELAGAVRAEGLRDIILAGSGQAQKKGKILYDFMAQSDDEVTVAVGDEVIIIDDMKSEEWWMVKRIRNGKEGVVPSSYVEVTGTVEKTSSIAGLNAGKSMVEQNRLEEERLAKESLRAARSNDDSRGSEVGPGVRLPERGSSLSASNISNNGQQRHRDSGRSHASKSKPDPSKVRTWTDRSKSFSVEAQYLALKDGKINLHKMNGVKIAVPVSKMSIEDLEYVERITGLSLDEDKPLADIKRQQGRNKDSPSGGAGVTIEAKPEYDWFQFFLSCDVAVGLCERYAQVFHKDSMDESVIPDIDATVLRNLGIREGDIIKIMRFLDKKYGRTGGKRGVGFGGEETIGADGESGGLFSGPGGALRNNTRKGRPAPAVQTSDIIDAKAFSQEPKSAVQESVATPLASVPTPTEKDKVRSGFDDDAWDVKPARQQAQPAPSQPSAAPTPLPPALTGSMSDLSLLSQPLEPIKVQPTAPPPQPQPTAAPQQAQPPQPPQVTPSFFTGIGGQQTGLPQQQTGLPQQQTGLPLQQTGLPQQQTGLPQQQTGAQFNGQMNSLNSGMNIARQRPAPPQSFQTQGSLMIPAPPTRPGSAPQANQQSGFSLPPLQPQTTGIQTSAGFQSSIAPPGQSLNELRMQQQYTGYNGPQQNMGMMGQQQNFNQFNPGMQQQPTGMPQQQNGFQYPMNTGMPQQNFGGGPFANPPTAQFNPIQSQPTGFQSSFPQQQFPQPTGINSFLPPALQPTPTGFQPQSGFQSTQNGFNSFTPPPMPPMPQQNTIQPLVPQPTGPPPTVRFGVTGDAKKLMPQPTGRRANLSQATPQNPFGF